MLSATEYLSLLVALQPPGSALPREGDSIWSLLLQAEAEELARVDGRAADLVVESDPRTSAELLPDWERVCGLPDGCAAAAQTMAERRAAVHGRLTDRGGQRPADYEALARVLGYPEPLVEEFRPFQVGVSSVGEALCHEDWSHCFRLHAGESPVRRFTTGQSCVGEPLASWGDELLECTVRRRAPAHAIVQFAYTEEA